MRNQDGVANWLILLAAVLVIVFSLGFSLLSA
jgi:hypothetical protein